VEKALESYRKDPNVLYAEPDYIVHALRIPNDPFFSSLWGLRNTGQNGGTPDADIQALDAWDITTGSKNVVVAVIDTGVDYNHEDLAANMWRNTADCDNNGIDDDGNGYIDDCYGIDTVNHDSDPMDDHDHGIRY
jgi:serine protease